MLQEIVNRCSLVVDDFRKQYISFDEARDRLMSIEEEGYAENPDAEPDGDITYAVSLAYQEVQELERKRSHQ